MMGLLMASARFSASSVLPTAVGPRSTSSVFPGGKTPDAVETEEGAFAADGREASILEGVEGWMRDLSFIEVKAFEVQFLDIEKFVVGGSYVFVFVANEGCGIESLKDFLPA